MNDESICNIAALEEHIRSGGSITDGETRGRAPCFPPVVAGYVSYGAKKSDTPYLLFVFIWYRVGNASLFKTAQAESATVTFAACLVFTLIT